MQVEQYDGAIGGEVSRRVMAIRLATGLVQGLLLYWLYRTGSDGLWPATDPYVFLPLLMLAVLLPPVFISSLGHMAPRKVALWTASAGAILLVLALYEAWRSAGVVPPGHGNGNGKQIALQPSTGLLLVCSGVFLYIAHALVLAGAQDGKRIASYGSYFEIAWKLAVQLLFSAFFVGALWAVLGMGAGLFEMIRLNFLKRLLVESWFAVPVICFAFSCALHITDVRPAIVRGIRTLLLVLASWILPVAVVIIGGFLCTLPFTGLEALWKTRYATVLLLLTVAVLVMLINAAFQNGQTAATLAIRISARMAAIVLLPLTGIAIYALGLRVHEYGWTADRIYAAACLVVASCYAIGYQWAAHRYETWLVEIAPINVGTAFVVLAVLLALFTPIADPVRLAVNNQVARLEKGLIKADRFDYLYLRFEGQRFGQAALERLARQGVGTEPAVVGKTAAESLKLAGRPGFQANVAAATPASIAANVTVWPASEALPESFLGQDWKLTPEFNLPECLQRVDQKCDALLLDADGDGQRDILLIQRGYDGGYLYTQQERGQGAWRLAARMKGVHCKERLEDLRAGHYRVATPRWKALEAGGVQLLFEPEANVSDCREEKQ